MFYHGVLSNVDFLTGRIVFCDSIAHRKMMQHWQNNDIYSQLILLKVIILTFITIIMSWQ